LIDRLCATFQRQDITSVFDVMLVMVMLDVVMVEILAAIPHDRCGALPLPSFM